MISTFDRVFIFSSRGNFTYASSLQSRWTKTKEKALGLCSTCSSYKIQLLISLKRKGGEERNGVKTSSTQDTNHPGYSKRPQRTRPAPARGKLNMNKSQTTLLTLYQNTKSDIKHTHISRTD